MKNSKLRRNSIFHSLGLERTYKPKSIITKPERQFTDFLKLAIGFKVADNKPFTFLQIGGFDGVNNDPLNAMIKKFNLPGLIVEPQPRAFELLKENYAQQRNLKFANVAISAEGGTRDFYTSRSSAVQVASFSKEHLIKRNVPEADIITQPVQCMTVNSLLKSYGFDEIDLIQIDAEGYDFEIVKTIDFSIYRPAILRFEHEHLSKRDFNAAIDLLAGHNYQFIVERRDLLALKAID